jgi:hypothetical protein
MRRLGAAGGVTGGRIGVTRGSIGGVTGSYTMGSVMGGMVGVTVGGGLGVADLMVLLEKPKHKKSAMRCRFHVRKILPGTSLIIFPSTQLHGFSLIVAIPCFKEESVINSIIDQIQYGFDTSLACAKFANPT